MGKHVTYWCHECHKFYGQGQGGAKQEVCERCRPVQTEMQLKVEC